MKILSVQSRHFWFCDQLIFSTLSGLESFREGNKEMSETRSLSQTINKNKRRVKNVCYRSSNWLKEQLKNVANKERWFTINRGVKMIHVVPFLLSTFIKPKISNRFIVSGSKNRKDVFTKHAMNDPSTKG